MKIYQDYRASNFRIDPHFLHRTCVRPCMGIIGMGTLSMGGASSLLYISNAYNTQKEQGVQIACKVAYVINGRHTVSLPLTHCPLVHEQYSCVAKEFQMCCEIVCISNADSKTGGG